MPQGSGTSAIRAIALSSCILVGAALNKADARTTVAGNTPVAFGVDQLGAATYSIPIEVPPGIGDMAPKLSLEYNSHSGNGLLGVGWSLSGLSTISRCPRTVATDGVRGGVKYDANDKLCLDGQRLVVISGTYLGHGAEYRTEVDIFSKIVSFGGTVSNGPLRFKVWTKSGLQMQYGYSPSSQVKAIGSAAVRLWAVNRITDAAGNYLTVTYDKNTHTGAHRPAAIHYTGNEGAGVEPDAEIAFIYGSRPDVQVLYQAGAKYRLDSRLTQISATTGTASARRYYLSYDQSPSSGRSRLREVEQCNAGNCLAKLRFAFATDSATGRLAWTRYAGSYHGAWGDGKFQWLAGDFDGDGLTDLARRHLGGIANKVLLARGDGTFAGKNTGETYVGINRDGQYDWLPGDFDGDGRTDLVRRHLGGTGNKVLLSRGDGTFAGKNTGESHRGVSGDGNSQWLAGDFNGDGKTDLVRRNRQGTHNRTLLSQGNGRFSGKSTGENYRGVFGDGAYQWLAGDVDGDGDTDLIRRSKSGTHNRTLLSDGNGRFSVRSTGETLVGIEGDGRYSWHVGEFNGDGLDDLVRRSANGQRNMTLLSRGDGTFQAVATGEALVGENASAGITWLVGDFNGDGLSDLLRRHSGGNNRLLTAQGDGAFSVHSTGERLAGINDQGRYQWLVGDFDGNGIADLVRRQRDGKDPLFVRPAGDARTLLSEATDSRGAKTQFRYKPLTDPLVYTKSNEAAYPFLTVQNPLQVVARAGRDDGLGSVRWTTYFYTGARVHLKGRGFVGFNAVNAIDGKTGVQTETYYRQVWPYIGQIDTVERFLSGSVRLSRISNHWAQRTLHGAKSRFAFLSQRRAERFEVNEGPGNVPVVTTETTHRYDDYGNATSVVVATTDSTDTFIRSSVSTYHNDLTRWRLGRLICRAVTAKAPGMPARSQVRGYQYGGGRGLLTKAVIEPASPDVVEPGGMGDCISAHAGPDMTLVTTYTHDGFGNRESVRVAGSGRSRTSLTQWGELDSGGHRTLNGRFPIREVDALGHETLREHDRRFGTVRKVIDLNGLQTRWTYDSFGRQTAEVRADGAMVTLTRHRCPEATLRCPGNAVEALETVGNDGAVRIVYTDRLGREVRRETSGFDGTAIYIDTEYDAHGRIKRQSRPYFAGDHALWTTKRYETATGRIIRSTTPDGTATATAYQGLVTTRTVTTPQGVVQRQTLSVDALGRTRTVTEPQGAQSSYRYDALGHLKSTTDAAGHVITMHHDIRGRKTAMDDPDMGRWTYRYNAFGELVAQTDAKGQTLTMAYDALGRLHTRVEAEGTTQWHYDTAPNGIGKLANVSAPSGYSRTHAYDRLGRPSTTTYRFSGEHFTLTQGYDREGRPKTTTFPRTGTGLGPLVVERVYNAHGHLQVVQRQGAGPVYWEAGTVNAQGQVTLAWLGNGLSTERHYDPHTGRVESIATGDAHTLHVQSLGYVFDGLGNLLIREDIGQNLYETFHYDKLNRIKSASVCDGHTVALAKNCDANTGEQTTYGYDAIGNLTHKSDVGPYRYGQDGAGPHAVSSAGSVTYTYDANGNMTHGNGRTVTWSSFNKPTAITRSHGTSTFVYGPDRTRIEHIAANGAGVRTTQYVDNAFEKITDNDPATPDEYHHHISANRRIATVIFKDQSPAREQVRYFHTDHLGSIDTVTDHTGAVLERMAFDPHGKRRHDDWTPADAITVSHTQRGFTDHEHLDGLGLIHMNGRVYDPELGRFLSADPFVQAPESTQSANRYSYAFNNPTRFKDPSGYWSVAEDENVSPQDQATLSGLSTEEADAALETHSEISNGKHAFTSGSRPTPFTNAQNVPAARMVNSVAHRLPGQFNVVPYNEAAFVPGTGRVFGRGLVVSIEGRANYGVSGINIDGYSDAGFEASYEAAIGGFFGPEDRIAGQSNNIDVNYGPLTVSISDFLDDNTEDTLFDVDMISIGIGISFPSISGSVNTTITSFDDPSN